MENKNQLIVRSNYLLESSFKLTLREQKIVYLLISKIKKGDTELKEHIFTIKELNRELGIKTQSTYGELKQILRELRSRTFIIKYIDKQKKHGELITGWINNADIKNGEVKIMIDPKLKPFLLELQKEFTKVRKSIVMQFKSVYSCRIYDLLKQYEKTKKRHFDIDKLRHVLCIENKYKRYSQFEKRVIIKAQTEINQKTDIYFEFKPKKTGKKITKIIFYIYSKNVNNNEIAVTKNNEIDLEKTIFSDEDIQKVKYIIKENITQNDVIKLLDVAKGDIAKIKEKYEISQVTNNIKNIVGWLIKAIKEDYQKPINKTNNKFTDFEQRDYDFEELERKARERLMKQYEDENRTN